MTAAPLDLRDRFAPLPDGLVYLDGNSLGRMPLAAEEALARVGRQWRERLIRGWNEGWFDLPRTVGEKIGRLIGADPGETVVADSTSVNLHKLAGAALRRGAKRGRTRVLSTRENFPSDLHILADLAPLDLVDGPDDLASALTEETALVCLSHVQFQSGELYDLPGITALARERGAMTLWDLSHSVGALPIDLRAAGADLAVGCGYKYLNGGPGAPAFLWVRRELQNGLRPPVTGWFGHADPFAFETDHRPAEGIERFLTGTPPVISLAALESGVDLLNEAGMARVRARSLELTDALISLFDRDLATRGFTLATPREPEHRGGHISLRHARAWPIVQALVERHSVVPDFRTPDIVRLGPSPLTTTEAEIERAVAALVQIVDAAEDRAYSATIRGVT